MQKQKQKQKLVLRGAVLAAGLGDYVGASTHHKMRHAFSWPFPKYISYLPLWYGTRREKREQTENDERATAR